MSEKVERYLNNKKNSIKNNEVAQNFKLLEDLYSKKQWFQLSELVTNLVTNEQFIMHVDLLEFYEQSIKETEHRFNPLQLVKIVIPIARKLFNADREAAFKFLNTFEKTVSKDALSLARLRTGQIELHLSNTDSEGKCQDLEKIKGLLDQVRETLDKFGYITPVHSSFYKVTSQYMDYTCDFAGYYNETLKYLGCEEAELLTKSRDESKTYAAKLIVAAMLGENLYDFGILIANPILDSLRDTEHEWMVFMLQYINSGNLAAFNKLRPNWQQFSEIVTNETQVREKIQLFCFMEISMANRTIPFSLVAEKAQVSVDDVEFLAMKTFSRGLVWGSIDQVDQVINIEWIKPRALSLDQIKVLADRVSQWQNSVSSMGNLVQNNAQDILAKM